MLDGIWNVYLALENSEVDGELLGTFQTRIGDTVWMAGARVASRIVPGQFLHLRSVYDTKNWKVRIEGNYKGLPDEFVFVRVQNLEPLPKVPTEPVDHKKFVVSLSTGILIGVLGLFAFTILATVLMPAVTSPLEVTLGENLVLKGQSVVFAAAFLVLFVFLTIWKDTWKAITDLTQLTKGLMSKGALFIKSIVDNDTTT